MWCKWSVSCVVRVCVCWRTAYLTVQEMLVLHVSSTVYVHTHVHVLDRALLFRKFPEILVFSIQFKKIGVFHIYITLYSRIITYPNFRYPNMLVNRMHVVTCVCTDYATRVHLGWICISVHVLMPTRVYAYILLP